VVGTNGDVSAWTNIPVTVFVENKCRWVHLRRAVNALQAQGLHRVYYVGSERGVIKVSRPSSFSPTGTITKDHIYSRDLGSRIEISGSPYHSIGDAAGDPVTIQFSEMDQSVRIADGDGEPVSLQAFVDKLTRASKGDAASRGVRKLRLFASDATPFGEVQTVMKALSPHAEIILDAGRQPIEEPSVVSIGIDAQGGILFQGASVDRDGIRETLLAKTKDDPDLLAEIVIDPKAPPESLRALIETAQSAGVEMFQRKTRQKTP
jgi:biopolymer transport protein ExbD